MTDSDICLSATQGGNISRDSLKGTMVCPYKYTKCDTYSAFLSVLCDIMSTSFLTFLEVIISQIKYAILLSLIDCFEIQFMQQFTFNHLPVSFANTWMTDRRLLGTRTGLRKTDPRKTYPRKKYPRRHVSEWAHPRGDISQKRHILERTYPIQDNSQKGHILERTYPRIDISQNAHVLECKLSQNDISQNGHILERHILERTYPRTDKSWKIIIHGKPGNFFIYINILSPYLSVCGVNVSYFNIIIF